MAEENTENNEVRDPAALLKAHEELKADFKSLKQAHEELQAQTAGENTENPWKAIALKNQVALALAERGIKNAAVAKYVDIDGLDLDEEGNIAGIEERITNASTEFPELFDAKRLVGGKADSGSKEAVNAKKSATESQLDALFR